MLDVLMGSVYKALMDKFIRDIFDHDIDIWWENLVWAIGVLLILFYNVDIDVVVVVFSSGLDGEISALGVVEVAIVGVFIGVTKEYTLHIEGAEV